MARPSVSRTLRSLFCKLPTLPPILGDALVVGGAPDPVLPETLLHSATLLTVNASQLVLEPHGISRPDITCMRSDMDNGAPTSRLKLEALRGRTTGHLVMVANRHDPGCMIQQRLLSDVGYSFESVQSLQRLDASAIYNHVLNPGLHLALKFAPSTGLRAVLYALEAGASRVALAGVSFRTSGCSYLSYDYKREHVDGDQEILAIIRARGLPVFATDAALSEDVGLPLWPEVTTANAPVGPGRQSAG